MTSCIQCGSFANEEKLHIFSGKDPGIIAQYNGSTFCNAECLKQYLFSPKNVEYLNSIHRIPEPPIVQEAI